MDSPTTKKNSFFISCIESIHNNYYKSKFYLPKMCTSEVIGVQSFLSSERCYPSNVAPVHIWWAQACSATPEFDIGW